MALKINGMDVTELLREKYKGLGRGWISLLVTSPEKSFETSTEALRILTGEFNHNGIYITLDRTFAELETLLAEKGVETGRIYFVDAASYRLGKSVKETARCKYVSGPFNIDAITSAVYGMITQIPGEAKFIFLDSVSTLLLYNALPRTIRFSQFLVDKLRKMEVNGVMVSVIRGMTDKKLVKELTTLCDEIIDIR